MTDTKHSADLPPLPGKCPDYSGADYSADQMHAYARAAIAAAAPAGEPVAWAVVSEKGGIHKLSITSKSAERKAATWKEEWPNNGCVVRPLVFGDAAPVPAAAPKAALTDAEIDKIWDEHIVDLYGVSGISPVVFARRIEAASGPNAALVTLLKEILDDGQAFMGAIELSSLDGVAWAERARAALAAAGVEVKP